jgi:prevent-host-death family protein
MIYPSEIHSLSDFQRHTREHMDRLKSTGRPVVLTVNGRAAVAVMDAEAFERLMAEVEEARTIAAVNEAMADIDRGGDLGIPVEEIRDRILGTRKRHTG